LVLFGLNWLYANYKKDLYSIYQFKINALLWKFFMRIPLDRYSSTPIYHQIRLFIQDQIKSGKLAPEVRLPASRDLAKNLGISRLTVTNAYAELEAQGLVYTKRGDGTYVASIPVDYSDLAGKYPAASLPTWQNQLLSPSWESASQTLDNLIASVSRPDLISFAEGGGDSNLFPLDDFRRALHNVLRQKGKEALSYGDSAGYAPLRDTIAQILTNQGIPAHPDQVLVTTGSQQALGLVVKLLTLPGDTVLIESPTHMGFIDLCHSLNIKMVDVPVDEEGMKVDRVEELLYRAHPKLIYTVPNFQNPTGACLNSIRRRKLVALAEKYNLPILEDDFVGDLRYKGIAQPALKALDRNGSVIYVGTFSKMLIPSLRIGFLVAADIVYKRLLNIKHNNDVTTSNLMQHALDAYITVGRYQASLRKARFIFNHRRAVMLAALSRYMPAGVCWNNPLGGLYIWLQLPEELSADEFFFIAAKAGVIYAPGSFFFPNRDTHSFLRLNFARNPPYVIEEGIKRLGKALKEFIPKRANYIIPP
jgi:GntR family transcriptional regulator/MocR family aminotransferase